MNIGALFSGDIRTVRQELDAFVEEAGSCVTKVILEVAYLERRRHQAGRGRRGGGRRRLHQDLDRSLRRTTLEKFVVMRDAVAGTGVKSKVAGVQPPRPQNAYAFLLAGADLIGTRAVPEIIDALDEMRRTGVIPGASHPRSARLSRRGLRR